MNRWFILIFLLLFVNIIFGQTPVGLEMPQQGADRVNLVSSSDGRINAKTGKMIFYNPVYEHKGNTLSADSGYLYENDIKQQFFEAFGNVVITQPSGTVIYADRLRYDATAQLATLTKNVKMVDGMSTLTTNYLTYNMRSKTGIYTGGGRIISQTDTITSKNAYYFETRSEAFFSKNVIIRNPTVKVYTDSMLYNSLTKDTHFYGPTNIKGQNNENLYTERGVYNTQSGVADFHKNNLYNQDSKYLKSDTLHYDRSTGVGEAYGNVVFVDTLDKFYAYGGKGTYRQEDESILMTKKPYIVTVVKKEKAKNDSTELDSLSPKSEVDLEKIAADSVTTDSTYSKLSLPPIDTLDSDVDSLYMTSDTLFSKMILRKDYLPLDLKVDRNGGQLLEEDVDIDYGEDETDENSVSALDMGTNGLVDISTNTKIEQPKAVATVTDKKNISTKPKQKAKPADTNPGDRQHISTTLKADSVLRNNAEMPFANQSDTLINKALKIAQNGESIKDSTGVNPADTARTRIVKAYYNVRLFKSDLQAVADSVYYGMQDSMFRFMGKPMIWAEGSQISADTIFMQIINQQMDYAVLKNNAFMVNAVLDSVKFNQLKGRQITAFFKDNNIEKLFVDGNAENLVFSVNEKINRITEMFHDRGGRIKVTMEGKKIIDYITVRKVDQKVYPFKLVTQENEILPGFLWRPQDRPISKDDLLNRKRELPKDGDTAAAELNSSSPPNEDTQKENIQP